MTFFSSRLIGRLRTAVASAVVAWTDMLLPLELKRSARSTRAATANKGFVHANQDVLLAASIEPAVSTPACTSIYTAFR